MFGKWIEHGGWFPDYQYRFFRRNKFTSNHHEVHGGFEPVGKVGTLNGLVYHYTYETVYAYVARMNDYTSLFISNKLEQNPNVIPRWHHLIFNPLSHFLRMFISKKGYKDGFHGFVLSLLDASYSMLVYAKLWEYRMQEQRGGKLPPINNSELNKVKRK
jgi:hypothetical protein